MNFLLDTCALSELTKRTPSSTVINWMRHHHESSYYLSVLTLGELKKGIVRLQQSRKKSKLNQWFDQELIPRFKDRIISINDRIAICWGELLAKNEGNGRSLSSIDSLIAASALAFNLILVTRNIKDFQDLGIDVINPWKIHAK